MTAAAPSLRTSAEDVEARFWIPPLLFLGDVLAFECAVLLGLWIRMAASGWYPIALAPAQFRGIALGILVVPLACLVSGLYPGYGLTVVERLRRRTKAVFFSFAGLIAWGYLAQRDEWSQGILLGAMLFALVLAPAAERLLIRRLIRANRWGMPVAIFGSGRHGAEVANRLRKDRALGLNPVAVLDLADGAVWSGRALSAVAPWLGHGFDRLQTAVVALADVEPRRIRRFVEALPFRRVIVAIDLDGDLGLALTRNLLIPWNRGLKRVIDVSAAAVLLLVAAPALAVCALWIRSVSPGPAFYVQRRTGYRRNEIGVWKLRTMHPGAEDLLEKHLSGNPERRAEWESRCKLRDDPRILPGVGHFLRRASLDELPQLWNVLKGEMSLVGPRPFPEYHLRLFSEDFQRLRECVYPGMTGLWQVSSREGDLRAQESLDRDYIRNWSLWLDLDIAVRTVRAVWEGRGAC